MCVCVCVQIYRTHPCNDVLNCWLIRRGDKRLLRAYKTKPKHNTFYFLRVGNTFHWTLLLCSSPSHDMSLNHLTPAAVGYSYVISISLSRYPYPDTYPYSEYTYALQRSVVLAHPTETAFRAYNTKILVFNSQGRETPLIHIPAVIHAAVRHTIPPVA